MTRHLVIMRCLSPHNAVPTKVHVVPEDIDCEDSWAEEVTLSCKDEFCKKFIEFENAQWYYDIV